MKCYFGAQAANLQQYAKIALNFEMRPMSALKSLFELIDFTSLSVVENGPDSKSPGITVLSKPMGIPSILHFQYLYSFHCFSSNFFLSIMCNYFFLSRSCPVTGLSLCYLLFLLDTMLSRLISGVGFATSSGWGGGGGRTMK